MTTPTTIGNRTYRGGGGGCGRGRRGRRKEKLLGEGNKASGIKGSIHSRTQQQTLGEIQSTEIREPFSMSQQLQKRRWMIDKKDPLQGK